VELIREGNYYKVSTNFDLPKYMHKFWDLFTRVEQIELLDYLSNEYCYDNYMFNHLRMLYVKKEIKDDLVIFKVRFKYEVLERTITIPKDELKDYDYHKMRINKILIENEKQAKIAVNKQRRFLNNTKINIFNILIDRNDDYLYKQYGISSVTVNRKKYSMWSFKPENYYFEFNVEWNKSSVKNNYITFTLDYDFYKQNEESFRGKRFFFDKLIRID
jgi:hypothetical protein